MLPPHGPWPAAQVLAGTMHADATAPPAPQPLAAASLPDTAEVLRRMRLQQAGAACVAPPLATATFIRRPLSPASVSMPYVGAPAPQAAFLPFLLSHVQPQTLHQHLSSPTAAQAGARMHAAGPSAAFGLQTQGGVAGAFRA